MSSSTDYDPENYERQTMGLVKTLGRHPEVCDIKISQNLPVSKSQLSSWEQKQFCKIPDDLRNFYLVMDGLAITWNVTVNGISIPVGKLTINPIDQLVKLTIGVAGAQIADLHLGDDDNDGDKDQDPGVVFSHPKFDESCRIFELDPCDGFGKVCLVYKDTVLGVEAKEAEIWFLDRSFRWFFLSESFLLYYRMMLVHLGLPQWQYAFTDIGLSHSTKQWFNLFCPLRLAMDTKEITGANTSVDISQGLFARSHIQLDVTKVFKGKTEKKKPVAQVTASQLIKRKSALLPPPLTTASSKPSSGKSTASAVHLNKLNLR